MRIACVLVAGSVLGVSSAFAIGSTATGSRIAERSYKSSSAPVKPSANDPIRWRSNRALHVHGGDEEPLGLPDPGQRNLAREFVIQHQPNNGSLAKPQEGPGTPKWLVECIAEVIGTAIIVGVGTSAAASAITVGETGLAVASTWAWIIASMIACLSHVSGAHFNPAISISTKVLQPTTLTWRKVARYIAAQTLGASLGAWVTLTAYAQPLKMFEKTNGILRSGFLGSKSASVVSLFFPNPHVQPLAGLSACFSCTLGAMVLEALGTGLLAFVVFSLGHPKNKTLGPHGSGVKPLVIGFTVACIVSFLAPLTMAGLNPARDIGPRLVCLLSGWGKAAWPTGGFLASLIVYTVGPIVGAITGGWLALALGDA